MFGAEENINNSVQRSFFCHSHWLVRLGRLGFPRGFNSRVAVLVPSMLPRRTTVLILCIDSFAPGNLVAQLILEFELAVLLHLVLLDKFNQHF